MILAANVDVWVFDGKNLTWCDKVLKQFPAVSGPYGKGELPTGAYSVASAVSLHDVPANEAYRDKAGNTWFAPLKPLFATERKGFGIHPDGNVPGTLGCIGLTAEDTKEVLELLSGPGVLYVV
jgi:hypothetical protein